MTTRHLYDEDPNEDPDVPTAEGIIESLLDDGLITSDEVEELQEYSLNDLIRLNNEVRGEGE